MEFNSSRQIYLKTFLSIVGKYLRRDMTFFEKTSFPLLTSLSVGSRADDNERDFRFNVNVFFIKRRNSDSLRSRVIQLAAASSDLKYLS